MSFFKIIFTFLTNWPSIKKYLDQLLGVFKKISDYFQEKKQDKYIEQAKEEVNTKKDTSGFEELIMSGKITKKVIEKPEEKKSPEIPIVAKVAAISVGAFAVSALFAKKASAAAMGAMGSQGSVILNSSVNRNQINGAQRMGSKLLSVLIVMFMTMGASTCGRQQNRPNYTPKIWAGDSENAGITRAQSGEFIAAEDPQFDNYIAITTDDLGCLYKTYISNCESFKQQVVNCQRLPKGYGDKLLQSLENK